MCYSVMSASCVMMRYSVVKLRTVLLGAVGGLN
jgi:hypothetical protein